MRKAGGMWTKCKSTTAGVPVPGRVRRHSSLFLSSKVRKFHGLLSDWAVMKMEMSLPQVTTKGALFVGWILHIHMHVTLWQEGVQQSSLQQLCLQIIHLNKQNLCIFKSCLKTLNIAFGILKVILQVAVAICKHAAVENRQSVFHAKILFWSWFSIAWPLF